MRTSGLACCTGVAASTVLALGQGDRPPLRSLGRGESVEPLRVAPARLARGGVERTGEWVAYGVARGGHDTCRDYRVFDCYGDHNFDGRPDDAGGCGLLDDRWYAGTGYCNPFYSNDMELAGDTIIAGGAWRADVAWYWSCGAGDETEQCVLAIFTQNSDPNACEQDTRDYPGWLIDFGDLACNPGAYYLAWIDLSMIGRWDLPPSGKGSYATMYLTDDGDSIAGCAQPMLWGSSNNWGDPDGPGRQYAGQLDDDFPIDLIHELPTECYTYGFECPDPLGAMAQFWGERVDPPGNRADINDDGVVDTRDISEFLFRWRVGRPEADCDGSGALDTRDVVCFLNLWVSCR